MDKIYQLFDKFTNMIPGNVQHMIRLGALLAWLILATVATFLSWQSGVDSAPELGQELSLSNIKEEIARKNNLKKTGDIVLPDLNDLIREKRKNLNSDLPQETRHEKDNLIKPEMEKIEPQNPVRSFNDKDKTEGPVFHGETHNPIIQNNNYLPKKDQGSGGVMEKKEFNRLPTEKKEIDLKSDNINTSINNNHVDPSRPKKQNQTTKKNKHIVVPYLKD